MKAGRNAGLLTSFGRLGLGLFEKNGLVRGGGGLQPVQRLVHGMEDLEVLLVRTHALELLRNLEGRSAGSNHRALRIGRKDLSLEAAGEGFHCVLVQVGSGEARKIDEV